MKIRNIALFCIIIAALMAGCGKELSYERPGGYQGDSSHAANFHAMIGGNLWAADSLQGAAIISGFINVTGVSHDGKLITITLNGTTTGTYALGNGAQSVITYSDQKSANPAAFATNQGADTSQSGGSVTVSSIDTVAKTISGTFQCKVYRIIDSQQVTITLGVFNQIPYTTTLPPAPATDSFNVVIADTPWTAPSIGTQVTMGSLEIVGTSLDGTRSVGLYFPQNITPGTYTLNYTTGTYVGVYLPTQGTTMLSDTSGILTILENNTVTRRVRGTFQFTAIDLSGVTPPVQLKQGYFSVGY